MKKEIEFEYFCPSLVEKMEIDFSRVHFFIEPTSAAQRLFLIALVAAETKYHNLYINISDTPFDRWLGLTPEATEEMIRTLEFYDFIKLVPMFDGNKNYFVIGSDLNVCYLPFGEEGESYE
ncbi:hypothetical protein CUN38_04950 [Enterococcus faecium]|uniref:hypothetical protein n=1 Tax=Enterococcus faecium TaxID=1352 RepID=UPI000CF06619|nr:hypothetical protein [Enterococcus faecium]PQC93492.1 hypothetical protein CUN38_04950 [Enterococcus faecium]